MIYHEDSGGRANLLQVPLTPIYLTVFESSKYLQRKLFPGMNTELQYFTSGFVASATTQVIGTPVDIVTQYQQVTDAKNVKQNKNVTAKRILKKKILKIL